MRSLTLLSLVALSATTLACNNEVPDDEKTDTSSSVERDADDAEPSDDGDVEQEDNVEEESTEEESTEEESTEEESTEEESTEEESTEEESTEEESTEEETTEEETTEEETTEEETTEEETTEEETTEEETTGPVIDDPDIDIDISVTDHDEDGFVWPLDCDDEDDEIFPGADEYCDDGIDSNCTDGDNDGGSCIELTPRDVMDMIDCSETPRAVRVTGEVIDITYNEYGLWDQRSSSSARGFRFGDGGADWTDLYSTWTDPQRIMMDFSVSSRGMSSTSYSLDSTWEPEGGDFEPECMAVVEIGNIIGVQHVYEVSSGVSVVKTELWDRYSGAMMIDLKVTASGAAMVSGLSVSHFTKAEIDGDYDSNGASSSDDRFAAAVGTSSGWSFGYGVCNPTLETVGATSRWSVAVEPDMCLPGSGYEDQKVFGWARSAETGLPAAARLGGQSVAMVVAVGTSSTEAENAYDDWSEDLCGGGYSEGSPADLDTCD